MKFFLILSILLEVIFGCISRVYDISEATLNGVDIWSDNNSDWAGEGFSADFFQGDSIEFKVRSTLADNATISFRYCVFNGYQETLQLRVNGQVLNQSLQFPATHNEWPRVWNETVHIEVQLNPGDNLIVLENNELDYGAHIDGLKLMCAKDVAELDELEIKERLAEQLQEKIDNTNHELLRLNAENQRLLDLLDDKDSEIDQLGESLQHEMQQHDESNEEWENQIETLNKKLNET